MVTEPFVLSCKVVVHGGLKDNLWKTCEWRRNDDNLTCVQTAVNDFEVNKGGCFTSIEVLEISRMKCSIKINASPADRKGWTCTLAKCETDENGGCSSKYASDCIGKSVVHGTVLITLSIILLFQLNIKS